MGGDFSAEIDDQSSFNCLEGVTDKGGCYCYTGWFGEHCDRSLAQDWPRSFLAWRVLFAMIYITFLLYCGWAIFKSRIRSIMLKGTRTTYENKWNLTSKKLIIVLIFVMSITRSIWLVVDPFDFNQTFKGFQINKLLNEISYSIEFSIYMVVLFIWYTLAEYTYVRSAEHNQLPKFILVLKHFGLPKAVIFYSMQILLSTIKIYQKEEFLGYIKSTQYILAGFLGFLFLEFVIMSYFLSKTLSEERKILEHQETRTRQASEKKSHEQKNSKRKQTLMPSHFLARGFGSAQGVVKQNSFQNMSPSWQMSKRDSINSSVMVEEPTKTKRRAAVIVGTAEPNISKKPVPRSSLRLEQAGSIVDGDIDSERMLFVPQDQDFSLRDIDVEKNRGRTGETDWNQKEYETKRKLVTLDQVFLCGLDDEEEDDYFSPWQQNVKSEVSKPHIEDANQNLENKEMGKSTLIKQPSRNIEVLLDLHPPGVQKDQNESPKKQSSEPDSEEEEEEMATSPPPPPQRQFTATSVLATKLDPITKSKLMIDHCLHDVVKRRTRMQRRESQKTKQDLYDIVNICRATNPKLPLPPIQVGTSLVDDIAPDVLEKSNWPREAYMNACTGEGTDWRMYDHTGVFKGGYLQMLFKKATNTGVLDFKDDFFGDAHRVFRRIFRMVLMVLLFLLLYSILFIMVQIIRIESPGVLLICLFLFEGVQAVTCFSLLLILKKIVSNMSHTMQAIHILISIQSLRKQYKLQVPKTIEEAHQTIDLNKLIRI